MRLGKLFCLSGICSIALALVLAHSGANAGAVLSPTELDGVCGGACGERCAYAYSSGCAPYEETGPCDTPEEGFWCPDEQKRTSCLEAEYACTDGVYAWCTDLTLDCESTYTFYQCEADNGPNFQCYWRQGQTYSCTGRDPSTFAYCDDPIM